MCTLLGRRSVACSNAHALLPQPFAPLLSSLRICGESPEPLDVNAGSGNSSCAALNSSVA